MPATYKFLYTFPFSSHIGGSTTSNLDDLDGIAFTFNSVDVLSQINVVGSGLLHSLNTRILVNLSAITSESKILSPCKRIASSGVKQCSAQ